MSKQLLIVLIPLAAALVSGLFGRWIGRAGCHGVTIAGLGLSLLLSILLFIEIGVNGGAPLHEEVLTWILVPSGGAFGAFKVSFALLIDRLTVVMLVVVTGVSFLVHVYSVGYMHEDPDQSRFFSYLSFFTFAMLVLVTGDNFLQLFFGWEGVGLASYLLIGFWYKKESASAAAIKAFLVNRVGDFGFAIGIFTIFVVFNTLDYAEVFQMARTGQYPREVDFLGWQLPTITLISLLLFVGAMGKSAQLGLHTWLPDAMEGPTPVSALIHAATMVTAGVFLVCRASPLFELSETALAVVTLVGAGTAFFAATVGLVQNDIKRVIAYSTCSQLGYMFFAAGVSAYAASMFHLFTHAFFKALLFLCAGAVIHAMHHEQDMRRMGGLWRKIPVTYGLMLVGTLALTGVPPLAGFYSKDAILESAYAAHTTVGMVAWVLGILAAGMTTFYSFRLIFMTFHGPTRADHHHYAHAHEAPWSMRAPLIVLAVGSVLAGVMGSDMIGAGWFKEAISVLAGHESLERAHHVGTLVKVLPMVMFGLGLVAAYWMYIARPQLPKAVAERCPRGYQLLSNAWYFDRMYEAAFVDTAKVVGKGLWKTGDETIIDGYGVNGVAASWGRLSQVMRGWQTGYVYHYAGAMLVGVLVLMTFHI